MKYICYYDSVINRRLCNIAAVNKINYISKKLQEIGQRVDIISCSMLANKKFPKSIERIDEKIYVHFFPSETLKKSFLGRLTSSIRRNLLLFFYIIKNVKKGETVLVYHSLANMRCISFAKFFKKFRLFLEVEEIYNDVYIRSNRNASAELRYFRSADMFLFPTDILAKKVNVSHKQQTIVYGTYEITSLNEKKYNDGRIHLAYTGSFDPNKGGLMFSLEIARYLNHMYCLHILGKGSDDVMKTINNYMEENLLDNKCEIRYDGLKSGDDYNRYLQKCHLGLSTQNPDAKFNNTSFPSKVISYLANNLRVLTAPIDVLTQSEFGRLLYYYYDNDPKMIASFIQSIDFNAEYDSISIIRELDRSFCASLAELIKVVKS